MPGGKFKERNELKGASSESEKEGWIRKGLDDSISELVIVNIVRYPRLPGGKE